MTSREKWTKIQGLIGTIQDGIPGVRDDAAIASLRKEALAEYQASKSQPSDTSRTDWRGFKDVDEGKLTAILPVPARPLVPLFLANAKRYDLNPLFLIAISRHETGAWTSNVFKTKSNAMGISNTRAAVSTESYNESIRIAAYSLSRPGGFYSKAKTLADVGAIYAPTEGNVQNDPGNLNRFWQKQVAANWKELETSLA